MKIERTPQKTIHYEVFGNGPALILVHGNGEDWTIFKESIALLQTKFTVYAFDTGGHGQSYRTKTYHYQDFADDLFYCIQALGLERPIFYGFSDGGILGLLLAIQHPDCLSILLASGANANPQGLSRSALFGMRLKYTLTRAPKTRMMLQEPNITEQDLQNIAVPTVLFAGQFDLIRQAHTEWLAQHIPQCTLHILKGETHGSYIVHSQKIGNLLLEKIEGKSACDIPFKN